jgi:hypothetical protein
MPKVFCDQMECHFNIGGECTHDEIELDYTATCVSFEEKTGTEAGKQ